MFCTSSQCNDVLTCTHCRQRRLLPGAASCWLPTTIAMIPSCMIYRVPLLLSGACTAPFNPDRAFQREHDKGSTGLCLSAPCGVALRTRFTPCSLSVCVCVLTSFHGWTRIYIRRLPPWWRTCTRSRHSFLCSLCPCSPDPPFYKLQTSGSRRPRSGQRSNPPDMSLEIQAPPFT